MSVTGWYNAAKDKSVTLTVEMAFGSTDSTSLWDTALWDTGTWGSDIVWTDVTEYVMGFSTKSGRSQSVNQFETGTAQIVLRNTDARFSPWNLSGPYVTAGRTNIRPWRPVRISRTHATTVLGINAKQYIFYGYMTAFNESYSNNALNTVTVSCVDELGRLARYNGYAQTPQGAGETLRDRIDRILSNAGYTGIYYSPPRVSTTFQATTLAQNTLTELKLLADSEGGIFYALPYESPYLVFLDRLALAEPSGVPIPNLYDSSSSDPLAFKFTNMTQAYQGDLVATSAAIGRVGGTVQRYTDQSARALYGDLQYSRTDLITESDDYCLSLARQRVDTYKDAQQVITSITMKPQMGPHEPPVAVVLPQNMWLLTTGSIGLMSKINVTSKPPGMSSPVTGQYVIDSVQHNVTMEDWTVTWGLSPADVFVTSAGLWDTGGVWDSSTWFY